MQQLRKFRVENKDLMRLQDNVDEVFRSQAVSPFVDGVLIEGKIIVTAGTTVNHGLQRQPRGWIIVDSTVAANFYRASWDERSLTLVSSADTIATIWVF